MLQRSDPQGLSALTLTALWLLVPRWLSKAGPRPSAGLGRGWGPLPAVCLPPLLATPPSSAGLNFIPQSGIVFSLILVIL